jgi:hypothetical protein
VRRVCARTVAGADPDRCVRGVEMPFVGCEEV